ncbi:heme o synthase [Aquirufa aurantiipilula]|uniref:heme o synthase n=1 Tax=Aquirufa aurantiipilula TaxID=2696561 RepID=UPI001CAA7556|nr:heme o synthase [Aquirufa aurantiipilula]MBZ1326169.1 protoheme IX farnesyltransferase [Aquirufa aurantiipilula]
MSIIKPYIALLKSRLSITVAFSGTFGYLLAPIEHTTFHIILISLAGYLLTGAANIVNQLKEIDYDKLMKRTAKRPLPTEVLQPQQAKMYGIVILFISLSLLSYLSWKAAIIGFISYLLYGFVYTPLKRVGPISVFVGAIPGAFPPMIGWLAATHEFGWEPGILFAIQFFWQFPHFWAIAWVADADYKKAGFKMLPNDGKKDMKTAFTIMIYTIFLVPLGLVPYLLHMTGIQSAIIAVMAGTLFLCQTFYLMMRPTDKAARWMMFGSFFYLLVVQIAFLFDKIS